MHPYIKQATRNLTLDELTEFTLRFKRERKKNKIAFLWWFFLGAFGGHRFYLGKYQSGIILAAITIFTAGLGGIIGLLDGFNVTKLVHQANQIKVLQLIKEVKRK